MSDEDYEPSDESNVEVDAVDLQAAELTVDERVDGLEEQVGALAEMVAELAAKLAKSARPKWRQRPFNPLTIAALAQRIDAWERLYVFVEYLNSTYGAYRSDAGMAPLYIRSGWWDSPLAVIHLAALCEAWVEAEFTRAEEPLSGGHDMLWLLMDRVVPVLELVCGRNVGESARWSQQDKPSWSLEPPKLIAEREGRRREDFEAFLAQDEPAPVRTGFSFWMTEELNPPRSSAVVGDETAPLPPEPPEQMA